MQIEISFEPKKTYSTPHQMVATVTEACSGLAWSSACSGLAWSSASLLLMYQILKPIDQLEPNSQYQYLELQQKKKKGKIP